MGNDLVERQSAIDALDGNIIMTSRESAQAVMDYIRGCADRIRSLPSAQPELIAQGAYVRGFEQGRTQGMLDAKLEPTCNQLATDTISRQAAIDALHMNLMYRMGTDSNKKRLDEWINNLPSAQPDHSGDVNGMVDLIDRQAAIDAVVAWTVEDRPDIEMPTDLVGRINALPSAQPERTCVNCGRTANNGGWYADGRTRCPIEEHYALPKDGYCHLWEKRNITDDDYPKRREE